MKKIIISGIFCDPDGSVVVSAVIEFQQQDNSASSFKQRTATVTTGWDFEHRKAELSKLFERNHRTALIEEQHRLAA